MLRVVCSSATRGLLKLKLQTKSLLQCSYVLDRRIERVLNPFDLIRDDLVDGVEEAAPAQTQTFLESANLQKVNVSTPYLDLPLGSDSRSRPLSQECPLGPPPRSPQCR